MSNVPLRSDWNGKPIKGGDLFVLRKQRDGTERVAVCSLYSHQLGYELTLIVGGELQPIAGLSIASRMARHEGRVADVDGSEGLALRRPRASLGTELRQHRAPARVAPLKGRARFVEPMLLLRTDALPADRTEWLYQLKVDGYRALAFTSAGTLHLRSRNNKDFRLRYPSVLKGLARLPNETILDGELVAFGDDGRPSFNALQNAASAATPIVYYVFDVLMLNGRDLKNEPLSRRMQLLETKVLPKLSEPIRYLDELDADLRDLIASVRAQQLEGLVAKRRDSRYESGLRTGAWQKMRVNQGQEFVIGGYTVGGKTFDALIFGYYEGKRLVYVARTRNGFTPAVRAQLMKRFRPLQIQSCPFVNLPETKGGRWGQGLTAEKMKDCRWLSPELVGQFEFVEWTPDDHLRHSKFIALREDKKPADVKRE
jgi:DNA ligase D-like protein (predicted ligase)